MVAISVDLIAQVKDAVDISDHAREALPQAEPLGVRVAVAADTVRSRRGAFIQGGPSRVCVDTRVIAEQERGRENVSGGGVYSCHAWP